MNTKYRQELINLFANIKNPQLMGEFLEDILTPKEFEEIVTRWQIIKQLSKGVPQREIAKNLGTSIATITRGSRELRDKKGGFWKVLKIKK
ncbi:helix-turn-helix domain-containing protein [Candidatus Kuenenbacteria bacterium]|nr:helix-turn-helix domain-containing protein [Candidatus Kuenenbacteria bacterium]